MALSRQEIFAAEAMHRYVTGYELRFKRNPKAVLYLLTTLFLVNITAPEGWVYKVALNHILSAAAMGYIQAATLSALLVGAFWFGLATVRYNRERAILGILEREHRDELPWHHPPPLPNRQQDTSLSRSSRLIAS